MDSIIKLVLLGVDLLNRDLARRAVAEGKTHGELLRAAMKNCDDNDVLMLQIVTKARQMQSPAAPATATKSLEQMRVLLAQAEKDARRL